MLFNLGMTHAHAGHHDEAATFLERCLAVSRQSESHLRKAYALLVGVQRSRDAIDEAQRRCYEGLGRYPGDRELLFLRAVLAQQRGHLDEAAEAYERLLSGKVERYFSSLDPEITGLKARQNLAGVYEAAGRWAEAERLRRQVVEEAPTRDTAWRELAENLLRQGESAADRLRALLQEMKPRASLRATVALVEARMAERSGQNETAVQLLQQAIEVGGDCLDLHHALCRLHFENEQDGEAESALKRLAALDPQDGSVPHNLGLLCLKTDRLKEAHVWFDRSLKVRPRAPQTHFFMGEALRRLGAVDQASHHWREALRLDPQHSEAKRCLQHHAIPEATHAPASIAVHEAVVNDDGQASGPIE